MDFFSKFLFMFKITKKTEEVDNNFSTKLILHSRIVKNMIKFQD